MPDLINITHLIAREDKGRDRVCELLTAAGIEKFDLRRPRESRDVINTLDSTKRQEICAALREHSDAQIARWSAEANNLRAAANDYEASNRSKNAIGSSLGSMFLIWIGWSFWRAPGALAAAVTAIFLGYAHMKNGEEKAKTKEAILREDLKGAESICDDLRQNRWI